MSSADMESPENTTFLQPDENKNFSDHEAVVSTTTVLECEPDIVLASELDTVSIVNKDNSILDKCIDETLALESDSGNISSNLIENASEAELENCNLTIIEGETSDFQNENSDHDSGNNKTLINLKDISHYNFDNENKCDLKLNASKAELENCEGVTSDFKNEYNSENNKTLINLKDVSHYNFDNESKCDLKLNIPKDELENCEGLISDFKIVNSPSHDSEIDKTLINLKDASHYNFDSENKCETSDSFELTSQNESEDNSVKDEVFLDSVQFFKDPSAFDCLETAGGQSTQSALARCSLYMNFDPLHASQKKVDLSQPNQNILPTLSEHNTSDIISEEQEVDVIKSSCCTSQLINKSINIVSNARFGNRLISFDSPIKSIPEAPVNEEAAPKLYSEEELVQAVKEEELRQQHNLSRIQLEFDKKKQESETKIEEYKTQLEKNESKLEEYESQLHEREKKLEEMEKALLLSNKLSITCHMTAKEASQMLSAMIEEKETQTTSIEKYKSETKAAQEDLNNVEVAFADLLKRYEKLKLLAKTFQENESHLKQQLEETQSKVEEKEKMYELLQTRTQTSLDNANNEITNTRKTFEAQMAVQNAQSQKDKMKISNLESDIKQLRDENNKLSVIFDDLMAKVKESSSQ